MVMKMMKNQIRRSRGSNSFLPERRRHIGGVNSSAEMSGDGSCVVFSSEGPDVAGRGSSWVDSVAILVQSAVSRRDGASGRRLKKELRALGYRLKL